MTRLSRNSVPTVLSVVALCILATTVPAQDSAEEFDWLEGPRTVDIGHDLAEITIGEGYLFADGDKTREIMQQIGNPPTYTEVGMIIPASEDASWFVVFEFEESGYISDAEKDDIDADAIFESIREGNDHANEEREEMGAAPLELLGWWESPRYDERSNNLVWALLGQSEGDSVVNYATRLLGRRGYISVTLVGEPNELATVKPEVETLMASFAYKPGNRYAEYREGDKLAQYGLTGLIVGGAGAMAVKTGLFAVIGKFFAKMGKLLVVVVLGIGAFFKKILAKLTGRSGETPTSRVEPPGQA